MVRISGLVYLMVILDEPKLSAFIKQTNGNWFYGLFSQLFTTVSILFFCYG
jgi:hypothetical protein